MKTVKAKDEPDDPGPVTALPEESDAICPNPACRSIVHGVGGRFHCRKCQCLFSENPEDGGIDPIIF